MSRSFPTTILPRSRRPRRLVAGLAGLSFVVVSAGRVAGSDSPTQPPPPASGFGARVEGVAIERGDFANPLDPAQRVFWLRPAKPAPKEQPDKPDAPAPVVVFLHGFGATGAGPYSRWLTHLAEEGSCVVYPTYPAFELRSGHSHYEVMWAGIEAGVRALVEKPGVRADPSRLGVIGHSFGGGAAPAMAARAYARRWGESGLFVACLAPWYDLDVEAWTHLPAHACLLVATFCDDRVCDPGIGATFPARAAAIPAERKALRVFQSDDHGRPAIVADHMAPLTSRGVDALDARGLWRSVDALRAFAFDGSAEGRAASLGTDADALGLGTWSDGTPIRPAATTWTAAAAPTTWWTAGGPKEKAGRLLGKGQAHASVPLPDPTSVVASRLPASERLMAEPPPMEAIRKHPKVAEALRGSQVALILPAGTATLAGEQTFARWAGPVVRLDAADESELAQALSRPPAPTALLVERSLGPLLWRPLTDPKFVTHALGLGSESIVFVVQDEKRDAEKLARAVEALRRAHISFGGMGNLGGADLRVVRGDRWAAVLALRSDPTLANGIPEGDPIDALPEK